VEEALLESVTAPLKITVNLAPEDPRRFDLEKQTLAKLRRTMPDVTVEYVAGTATGLFEQAREHYGELWYELGGKRIVGRSTTTDGVLDAVYELAGLQAPQEGEAGHRGHPLAARPVGAMPLFYGIWPLAVLGMGLFLHRRRLT
jgi:ABC-2 type transport system permease protein